MIDAESEEAEGEDQSEEGEAEIDEGDYGEEKEAEDDEEKDSNTEEIEDFLDDQDSEEEMRDQIKIPSDIEDAEDEYGGEDEESQEEGEAEVDEDEEFGQFAEEDDVENDVFNLAKENNEMGDPKSLNKAKVEDVAAGALSTKKAVEYANKEMIGRIEKLEDSMVGGQQNGREAKSWQLTGEVQSKARPVNSLLEQYLDFDTVSKLPPTITQEKSTNIETMIKQRILDELFDDPIRKYISGKKGGDDDDQRFDFSKSKKGLGELYEDDYRKKLLSNDPNAYMIQANDLTGADGALKQEIAGLVRTLFYQLDSLSNLHFTPRPPTMSETQISTQNVPSIMIEDAIPISVSTGQSKSAREVFSINNQKLREKGELTKEERRHERATRKRKIKSHLKAKEVTRKEEKRATGVAMADRFESRHLQKKAKATQKARDDKSNENPAAGNKRNDMKSAKFFSRLQDVAKDDAKRKDDKRKARNEGHKGGVQPPHNNESTKRFKL